MDWPRIKVIVADALDLPLAERDRFIEAACGGEPELLEQVRRLLAGAAEVSQFLNQPAPLADALMRNSRERIGPWRLGQELGRGGMGVVFLAHRSDGEFEGEAAIKVLPPAYANEGLIRRFRQERQVLASLDHPGIARFLDAGTTEDGLPYLVMEYVAGQTLDRFLSAATLALRERLQLFMVLADAVGHAHQRLVIHRDIKPTNVLVTSQGQPKLLDFGVSKLLADVHDATLTQHSLGYTVRYAAPEQLQGQALTTATDVHALGVLLYELLTGQHPFAHRDGPREHIQDAICTQTPTRPSEIATRAGAPVPARLLQGDLDVIVAKSLAKEPEQRYPSAMAMHDDVERHLNGLPITARAPTVTYQLSRFVARHRVGTSLSVVALVGILSAAGIAIWQADLARQERDTALTAQAEAQRLKTLAETERARADQGRLAAIEAGERAEVARRAAETARQAESDQRQQAETARAVALQEKRAADQSRALAQTRFEETRAIANRVIFDYHDRIAKLPGATPVREALVKDALSYLDKLAQQAGNDAALQREVGAGYRRIGEILGDSNAANLGKSASAVTAYQRSLETLTKAEALDPKSLATRAERIKTLGARAFTLQNTGQYAAAAVDARERLRLAEALVQAMPTEARYQRLLSAALLGLARLQEAGPHVADLGDAQAARANLERSLKIREQLVAQDGSKEHQNLLAAVAGRLSAWHQRNGSLPDAKRYRDQATRIMEALTMANPDNEDIRRNLAVGYSNAATLARLMNDPAAADPFTEKALPLYERIWERDRENMNATLDFAIGLRENAELAGRRKDLALARTRFERALGLLQTVTLRDPKNTLGVSQLGLTHQRYGMTLTTLQEFSPAFEQFEAALKVVRPLRANAPTNDNAAIALASVLQSQAEARFKARDAGREVDWVPTCAGLREAQVIWQDLQMRMRLPRAREASARATAEMISKRC
jgi:eukaryotic-like serine/threonine-protein kinase